MKKWGEGAAAKGRKKPSETEEADREARRHHTPRAPSPIPEREFRRALLQEPLEDWEYAIPLEGDREAQEGLESELLQGEPGRREAGGVEDGQVTETGEGERESTPAPEEPPNPGVPPGLEGPQRFQKDH